MLLILLWHYLIPIPHPSAVLESLTVIDHRHRQVYTLIAQRDNYLSLDVAYHTRRDSTDMRMIAAVTLFFLPGMFTAV